MNPYDIIKHGTFFSDLAGSIYYDSIICAVYTEKEYRCQGIAGKLLDIVVKDMKSKGITPIYLITDHVSFYERYGWEFLCMVQGDNEPDMSRIYIHR